MRDTTEIAHDHAEAVIQRHRNAEDILMGEVLQTSYKIPIVEDIMMAQSRSFGKACCATGVLNVNRVIKLLLTLPLVELLIADRVTHRHQLIPGKHSCRLL